MKTNLFILIAFPCSLLLYSFTFFPGLPQGWHKSGNMADQYDMGMDYEVLQSGKGAAFIASKAEKIKGFGTLMQTCSAEKHLGKKIRLSGFMKTDHVKGWAGLWLRVDDKYSEHPLRFDNMQNRPVKGTTDWKKYEIELDVPVYSSNLNFGALLVGTGRIWFDEIKIEILGDMGKIPTSEEILDAPFNLQFEN
ncbi:MAG: hypothetical protein H6581_10280 [Bacteroidia bacterium]|nr:hypothetical protein [Bacteroidia bacterium]